MAKTCFLVQITKTGIGSQTPENSKHLTQNIRKFGVISFWQNHFIMPLQTNPMWLLSHQFYSKYVQKHAFWPKSPKTGDWAPNPWKFENLDIFHFDTITSSHLFKQTLDHFSILFFCRDIKFSLNVVFYIPRLNPASSSASRLRVEMACNRERHGTNKRCNFLVHLIIRRITSQSRKLLIHWYQQQQ